MTDLSIIVFDKTAAKAEIDTMSVDTPDSDIQWWTFDIDIIKGYPRLLDSESNNPDQRAAISAFTEVGTIPGALESGIDWTPYLSQERDIVNVDNQIKRAIQNNVEPDISKGIANMYGIKYYAKSVDDTHLGIQIIRGGGLNA